MVTSATTDYAELYRELLEEAEELKLKYRILELEYKKLKRRVASDKKKDLEVSQTVTLKQVKEDK